MVGRAGTGLRARAAAAAVRGVLGGVALLGLLALAAPSWLAAQDALDLPAGLYVLFNNGTVQRYGRGAAGVTTVTPEDAFVIDFGIAPDGNWIAYRTESGLVVSDFSGEAQTQVEGVSAGIPPFRGQGDTIAWSPQGDAIAYTTTTGIRLYGRDAGGGSFFDTAEPNIQQLLWSPDGRYLAAGADQNIWWIYRRDEQRLTLVSAFPASSGAAWYDSGRILFAPDVGGLVLMDLDNQNAQTVLMLADAFYYLPYVRSDSSIVAFSRGANETDVPEGSGKLVRIIWNGGVPARERTETAAVNLSGLRWAPEGRLLVALRSGIMILVSPETGQGFTLPIAEAVAYGWGPPEPPLSVSVALPQTLYFRADDVNGITQVWRMPPNSAPLPVTRAEAPVTAYTVRDTRLIYAAGEAIWQQPLVGDQDAVPLLELGERVVRDLALAPDGDTLVYTLRDSGVWQVALAGGDPVPLLANGLGGSPPFYHSPRFAPNLNALLVTESGSETTGFLLYDLASGGTRPIGAFDAAFWLDDGRVLGYGNGVGIGDPPPFIEVVAVNPNTGESTQIFSLPGGIIVTAAVQIAPQTVRFAVAANPGRLPHGPYPAEIIDIDLGGGGAVPAGAAGFLTGLQIAPGGRLLAGFTGAQFSAGYWRGTLIFRDTAGDGSVLLGDPLTVWDLQWDEG